jgi:hypothetical protein
MFCRCPASKIFSAFEDYTSSIGCYYQIVDLREILALENFVIWTSGYTSKLIKLWSCAFGGSYLKIIGIPESSKVNPSPLAYNYSNKFDSYFKPFKF